MTSVEKTAKQLKNVSKIFLDFRKHDFPNIAPEAAVLKAFYGFVATAQMLQRDYKFRLFRAEDISHLFLVFVFLCLFVGILLTHWTALLLKDQSWTLLLTCLATVPVMMVLNGLLAFATLHYDDEKINDPKWIYICLSVALTNLISVITLIIIHGEYQSSMPISLHKMPSEGLYPADLVLCLLFLPVLEFIAFPSFAWWNLWPSYFIGVAVAVWSLVRIQATGMVSMVLLAICFSTICLLSLRQEALKSYSQYLHEEELQEEVLATKAATEKQYADMVRTMIAGVAHDLKTPLSSLTLCIDAFDQLTMKADAIQALSQDAQEQTEKINEYIADIRQVCDSVDLSRKYMQVMVNRYVDYAKISNGLSLVPMLSRIVMKPLLDDIIHTANTFADCTVNWKVDPLTDTLIMITDYLWFEESLICLLTNACKFSLPTEPIDIEIKAIATNEHIDPDDNNKRIRDNGQWSLKMTVEDRGIGVSLACRDSVFKYPLGQSPTASINRGIPVQQHTGGAGLGLYTLAARVAALHGQYGYLPRQESTTRDEAPREKGSVFYFQVPIALALDSKALPPSFVGSFLQSPSISRKSSKGGGSVGTEQRFIRAMKQPTRRLPSFFHTPSTKNMVTTGPTATSHGAKSAGSSWKSSTFFAAHLDVVEVQSPSGPSTPSKNGETNSKTESPQIVVIEEKKKQRSLHILVVDDSVSIRKMSAMVLSKQGHRVAVAVNGQDAVDKLSAAMFGSDPEQKFDAVLMDIQMPGMDGLTATKLYREIEQEHEEELLCERSPRGILIIGMSACTDDVIAEQAHQTGMDFFLHKPFSINQFNDILVEQCLY